EGLGQGRGRIFDFDGFVEDDSDAPRLQPHRKPLLFLLCDFEVRNDDANWGRQNIVVLSGALAQHARLQIRVLVEFSAPVIDQALLGEYEGSVDLLRAQPSK